MSSITIYTISCIFRNVPANVYIESNLLFCEGSVDEIPKTGE